MEEERVSNEAAYKGMRELTCDDSSAAQYHLRETRRTWKVLEWVTTRSQLRGSRSKEIKSEASRRRVPGLPVAETVQHAASRGGEVRFGEELCEGGFASFASGAKSVEELQDTRRAETTRVEDSAP